jgi:hypothetical protein
VCVCLEHTKALRDKLQAGSLFTSVFVLLYLCVCVCVCVHNVCVCVYVYKYMYIHTHTHTHYIYALSTRCDGATSTTFNTFTIYMYINTCIHTHTHTLYICLEHALRRRDKHYVQHIHKRLLHARVVILEQLCAYIQRQRTYFWTSYASKMSTRRVVK